MEIVKEDDYYSCSFTNYGGINECEYYDKNSAKLIFQLFNDGNNLFINNNICLNII